MDSPEGVFNRIMAIQRGFLSPDEIRYCPSCHAKAVIDGKCKYCCFISKGYYYDDPCEAEVKTKIKEEDDIFDLLERGICPSCGADTVEFDDMFDCYDCGKCQGRWTYNKNSMFT